MKIFRRTRGIIILGLILVMLLSAYLFISSFKKQITIVGFAYENDVITISQSKISLQTTIVDTINENKKRVCNFYKEFYYYKFGNKVNLKIELDSANHKLLDTVLILTEKNKVPVISFEDPTKTKFKRRFFVIDQTDRLYDYFK